MPPIFTAKEEAPKFKPEKGLKLFGFTDASNIMRLYYTRDTNIFIIAPRNIVAIFVVAKEMQTTKNVFILRFVWRKGQSNDVLGILTPNISNTDNVMLDLVPPRREKIMKLELTLNPILEWFYNFLHLKSRRLYVDVPPIHYVVKCYETS